MRRLIYAGGRLALAVPVLFCIAVLNFFLIHLAPGDPASVMAGGGGSAAPAYIGVMRPQIVPWHALSVLACHLVCHPAKLTPAPSSSHPPPLLPPSLPPLPP